MGLVGRQAWLSASARAARPLAGRVRLRPSEHGSEGRHGAAIDGAVHGRRSEFRSGGSRRWPIRPSWT